MQALRRTSIALAAALAVSLPLALGGSMAAPATADAAYGSIAVNPTTGAAGISFGKGKKANAKRAARRSCPGACTTVGWVRNGCAAVFRTDVRFFWGAARQKRPAIRRARNRAKRSGQPGVRRVAWVCSG